jgi:hypothetical protein
MSASLASFYDKLHGLDLSVSEALVRETAADMRKITSGFSNLEREIISGYRNRIVDGSKITATERRLKVLRDQESSPLPGFGLVVFEPECRLITETILCNVLFRLLRLLNLINRERYPIIILHMRFLRVIEAWIY